MNIRSAIVLFNSIPSKWTKKSEITGARGQGTKDIGLLVSKGWVLQESRPNKETGRNVIHVKQNISFEV